MDIYVDNPYVDCECGERVEVVMPFKLNEPVSEYVAQCDRCGHTVKCDADLNSEEALEVLQRIMLLDVASDE